MDLSYELRENSVGFLDSWTCSRKEKEESRLRRFFNEELEGRMEMTLTHGKGCRLIGLGEESDKFGAC